MQELRILVLSAYYPPDLGPGALRAAGVVRALGRRMPPGSELEVITTAPNRYAHYRPGAVADDEPPGVTVQRVAVGGRRLPGFLRYSRHVLRATAGGTHDLVFATSARLGTAVLAARVAAREGSPLVLDLRDDVAADVRAVFGLTGALAAPALRALEGYALAHASAVSLVSPGFVGTFQARWPSRDFLLVPHGIPPGFAAPIERAAPRESAPVTVLYAGTIGECQALHRLVPDMARALRETHRFVIVGGGSRRDDLARRTAGLPNVRLCEPVAHNELGGLYAEADVLLVSLAPHEAFEAVVPSKLFEVVAQGRPIVAGVGGEAARFLRRHAPDARIFPPGDAPAAAEALRGLTSRQLIDRSAFRAAFRQDVVIEPLATLALDCAKRTR